MLSDTFIANVRSSPITLRRLAKRAGTDEFWLSRLLSTHRAVRNHDPRILRLGKQLGLTPEQIFAE